MLNKDDKEIILRVIKEEILSLSELIKELDKEEKKEILAYKEKLQNISKSLV